MTGESGRRNWAGDEHFAYSRPTGPCLDRAFNAIVSCFDGGGRVEQKPVGRACTFYLAMYWTRLSVGRREDADDGGQLSLTAPFLDHVWL
mmetsp:Transcript_30527/g.61882  ORF Transcript_30527/g.61882 Transcript_30527/m.61882 type:complete len:90 (-) Transcript_30527:1208-1477(-)